MADTASQKPTHAKTDTTTQPAHRVFKDRPSGIFIDEFAAHVKETGEPETFKGLFRGKIPRDAEFKRLRPFSIDRVKRPNADMAPCPRCGQNDKFLHGDLAWFPKHQYCAAIGHCCAGHEALAAAEREFKWRQKRDHQESYLLAGLPLIEAKLSVVRSIRPQCAEALRVYRQFRKEAPQLHGILRQIKEQYGGHLMVTTVLRDSDDETEADDYTGPAGFRGRGRHQVETRDTDLGMMTGLVALHRDFNPVKDLEYIERQLLAFGITPTEEEAVELIVNMSEKEKTAAVAFLQSADKKFAQLAARLAEFWSFFSADNIALVQRYADHRDSRIYVQARHQTANGRTVVRFEHREFLCLISFTQPSGSTEWPTPADEDKR